MNNFLIVISIAAIALSGCAANTGIVKISDDTYMLAKQSILTTSGSSVKIELYKEANEYCAKIGKRFVQVSHTSTDSIGYNQLPSAEIQFKCQ